MRCIPCRGPILILLLLGIGCKQKPLDLEPLEVFAQSAWPVLKEESFLPSLPEPSKEVLEILRKMGESQRQETIPLLSLVFLRIYRSHLACCHQGYELRTVTGMKGISKEADPLLFWYNEAIGRFSNLGGIEMVHSYIAFEYLKTHPELLEDPNIREEFDRISTMENRFVQEDFSYHPNTDWVGMEALLRERSRRLAEED